MNDIDIEKLKALFRENDILAALEDKNHSFILIINVKVEGIALGNTFKIRCRMDSLVSILDVFEESGFKMKYRAMSDSAKRKVTADIVVKKEDYIDWIYEISDLFLP